MYSRGRMNRASKRRTFFFSFLFAIALAFAFFHHTLICFGVKTFLAARLPKGETLVVNYEKGKWEDGAFVLQHVSLSRKDGEHSAGFDVKIENLRFVMSMQLFPFHFGSQVVIDSPEIALLSGRRNEEAKKKGFYALCQRYLFKKEMVVNRGKIGFHQGEPIDAYFSVQTGQGTSKAGQFHLAQTEEKLLDSPVVVEFSMQGKQCNFDVHFQELDLPWVASIARFFSVPIDPTIELFRGNLSGGLAFGMSPENQISHIQYDLKLADFALSHTRYGVLFSAHQVNWKEHFTSNEEMGRWSQHPFFEKIWPYFIGDGEFLGAKILIEDPESGVHQGTVELRGKLQFSVRDQPLMDFYGLFSKEGREYPLRVIGEGVIEDDHNWKLAVDLSLHQEGGEKMTSYFALTSQGLKKYLFESRFQNISRDPADLIQHLVKIKYPHLTPFHIEKGVFDGSLVGWIAEKRFKRLEIKEVMARNVCVRDHNHGYFFASDQMKGKGEFDFSTPDFFDGTFWELSILEGAFKGPGKVEGTHLVADLSMHDQYVKPSSFWACFHGIEGGVRIEGLYTHLNVGLDFTLIPEDLFSILGVEKEGAHLDEKLALDFDMHLKTTKERLLADGTLEITRENKAADTLSFGARWDVQNLVKKGLLKGFSLGWFKAEHLSSETLNLPLEFFGKSWKTEGHAAIEGTLNREKIVLSIDPTMMRYVSPEIFLQANTGEGKAPTCHFCYEFAAGLWSGKVPLKKAKLFEKNIGLEFEAFSSEIDLSGTLFEFQNVSALSKGVSFEGEISLDYQHGDYGELFIQTSQVEGSAQSVQQFLRCFDAFALLDVPLEGRVTSGMGGMSLRAFVGEREELLSWDAHMTLHDGTFSVTPLCSFEKLTTRFEWSWNDRVLRLLDSDGNLCLGETNCSKTYHLNIPVAFADFRQGNLSYDLRLETPTHDICRLVGKAQHDQKMGEMHIHIDPEHTRFFGAKVDVREFTLGADGEIERLDFETDLSARDLYHHLDFLVHAGLVPIKAALLEEMQSPRFEGSTHLKMAFNRAQETLTADVQSDHFTFGTIDLEGLLIHAERKGNHFKLDRFKAGSLAMNAEMIKQEETWNIPAFDLDWKNCRLRGNEGFFHQEKGVIKLPLKNLLVDLSELLKIVPNLHEIDISYITGKIASHGFLELDLSQGLKNWSLAAQLELIGEGFSKGNLRLESGHPIHLQFSPEEGIKIADVDFNFFHPRSNPLWAKFHLNSLNYNQEMKQWEGKGVNVVLPPEMLAHLGKTGALPYLSAEEEGLVIQGYPFKWDNQIELTFDFKWGEVPEILGRLKEGYYWIQDKAWYLNDFRYHLRQGDLDLKMSTLLDDLPFDLHAELQLFPHLKARVTVQETIQEDRRGASPLTIVSSWSDHKGFFIQSIEGVVCGLDFSFHHNPRGSFLDQMVLTGQVKIDVPTFSKCLPKTLQESIQEFEIGKGYEISGDCILSKENLLDSHFTGYLKGKKFELMGSQMDTLLSEITIHTDHIELSHFNISDASGIFTMHDIRIAKQSNCDWNVTIPELSIQDFRPSLLKKVGRYRGRIKPMNIREMNFRNIRGILGEAQSFTGKGSLMFTNTFKRDYNILDIPFEILARLGLDMGLLVPIHGNLDYVLSDGKIYFTKLSDSYSEGKRSKFYLSPHEPSYIDFEGNLNINIKMKQYVLLKITEPFTLSIAGTFEDIRYSLK